VKKRGGFNFKLGSFTKIFRGSIRLGVEMEDKSDGQAYLRDEAL
jgi:hypothetical protein